MQFTVIYEQRLSMQQNNFTKLVTISLAREEPRKITGISYTIVGKIC